MCIGDNLPETSLPAGIPILPENLPLDVGHYRFTVAVTDLPPLLGLRVPSSMRDFVDNVETGFFLLDSKLLDRRPPPLENLIPTVDLGGVLIHSHPNVWKPPVPGPPMPPWEYPLPLPKYVICPLKLNMENTTEAEVTVSNIKFDVYILGQYAGDGLIEGPYTIPAKKKLSIKEEFRADFSTAGEIVMRFLKDLSFESTSAENLDITLVGSASVTSGTQTKVISFGEIPVATTSYNLATSVSPSGAGSVSPPSGQYTSGTSVTLTATPASGYTFDYWSGDASGSSPTITITMDSNKSIVAHFSPVTTLPNVTIHSVIMPSEVEVGETFTYTVTLKSDHSSSVVVTLKGSSSATGEFLHETIAIAANDKTMMTKEIHCSTHGVRTISFRLLYQSSELDSWSGSLNAIISSEPTTMSFNVGCGPFGYKKLTSHLVEGQHIEVSFTIAGGNNDIYVYVHDPSNVVVAGSKDNRFYNNGQFGFTASVSGTYTLYFNNTFSPFTSKDIQATITGGQWE